MHELFRKKITKPEDLSEEARTMIFNIPYGGLKRFIMTNDLLDVLKRSIAEDKDKCGKPSGLDSSELGAIYGVPIEAYETVKECLDRMMEQKPGDGFKLVVREIPLDLIDHPWPMKAAMETIKSDLSMLPTVGFDQ